MSIYNFQNVVDQSIYCLIDLTFWLITSLIFNRFSIRKKFWKAETQGFPTIVSTVCHVKSMGASTAGDFGSFLSSGCIFPQ